MIFLLEKKKNCGEGPRQGVDYRVLRLPRPSLPLSCQRSSFSFFFPRLGRSGGVCASQPRYRPLSRKPRLCPGERSGLVSTPSLHESLSCTRGCVCARARACISVGTTHEGENAERILERRSSSRIDDFFILALILEVFSRGIICLTKFLRNNFGSFDLGIQENFMRLCESQLEEF